MHNEVPLTGLFSPPMLVYLAIGFTSARMLMENEKLRGITTLQWIQFFVRASSIILLWPLVLFTEKFEQWIHSVEGKSHDDSDIDHNT